MIDQIDGEHRLRYLSRVLEIYMDSYGHYTVDYDDATCDGMCLAEEIMNEIDRLLPECKDDE